MVRDLTDRAIVITGASSGIGAATSVACARAGMNVVLAARRVDRLRVVADEVEAAGRRAVVVTADVTDPGHAATLLDAADDAFGEDVHAVFANAGHGLRRPMAETSDAELRDIFEVNFFASMDLLREAAGRLRRDGRNGHLLMCSSCVSKFTTPLGGAYCATKAAQNHACRAMRLELAPHGIDVSSVHPVGTRTEFFTRTAERSGEDPRPQRARRGSFWRWFMQEPEVVARAVVRCLRRPVAEVWTSRFIRAVAAAETLLPGLLDLRMRRAIEAIERDMSHGE